MTVTLDQLARFVGGTVLGNPELPISGAATLDDAASGEITFLEHVEKRSKLNQTKASAVLVPISLSDGPLPAILVDDVLGSFVKIVQQFRPPRSRPRGGVSEHALVRPSARLGKNVEIHPGATIGEDVEIGDNVTIHSGARIMDDCRLGDGVTVFPNVVLYEGTVVGPRSLIHAGAVLGAYGFGYKNVGGQFKLSAQLGWVEIGADVEIGACATIDRGAFGPTRIGDGTKIDNLVMIAHNCRLGRHNLICSQVGVAGSTSTGDYVVMAGQVGVCDHVHVGDRAVLGAKAGVSNDVPADMTVLGSPAKPIREQRLLFAAISKLPELRKEVRALERQVAGILQAAGMRGESPTSAIGSTEAIQGDDRRDAA